MSYDGSAIAGRAQPGGRRPAADMTRSILLLVALLEVPPLAAQAVVSLRVDNDAMVVGPRHDRDYSHGIDASVGKRHCADEACRVVRLGLVHALFTPNLLLPLDPPDDRAFAGYLGARGALEHWDPRGTWQLTATLGARGPIALGEPLQNFIHDVLGFLPPPSWDHQLPSAAWIAIAGTAGRWLDLGQVHAGALAGAELGTMRTFVEAGLRAGVGADARWLAPTPIRGFRAGLGVEGGIRWLADDVTLTGIEGGEAVADQRAWRPWATLDGTLRLGEWAATLSMSWFGKDFDAQQTLPVVGSARLQWTPGHDATGRE